MLYMVVACRIAQLMFKPNEWKAAYILNTQQLTAQAPTRNEVARLVARLGSFLAQTGDREAGVKTTWLGILRVLDLAAGIRFFRELQAQGLVYSEIGLAQTESKVTAQALNPVVDVLVAQ